MKKVYLIALLAALLAAFVSYLFVQSVHKNSKITDAHTTRVYIAFEDVDDGVTINNDNFSQYFEVKEVVDSYRVPGFIAEDAKKDVIGRVTTRHIYKGEQLSQNAFSEKDSDELDLAYALYPGEQAIAIPCPDDSGVNGYIRPGDTVDIIASYEIDEAKEKEEAEKQNKLFKLPDTEYNRAVVGSQRIISSRFVATVVKDVEVLAIGTSEEQNTAKVEGTGDLQTYDSIVLRVKEKDSDAIYRILQHSKGAGQTGYTLVLNSREDSAKTIEKNHGEAMGE